MAAVMVFSEKNGKLMWYLIIDYPHGIVNILSSLFFFYRLLTGLDGLT